MGISQGYSGPHQTHYLFIDGEQLRQTLKEVGTFWFGKPIDIDYRKLQRDCQKVFYYDCLPAKRDQLSEIEYQHKLQEKQVFFDELRSLAGWHVSEGLARHRKKERQEQKEVDILIAVDMLTHTHRKNMDRLTFLSGDQDFAPLLEAVVRDGMYVELLYPEGHTARDLKYFADVAKPMDIDFLLGIATEDFRRGHAFPQASWETQAEPDNATWTWDGMQGNRVIGKGWKEANGTMLCFRTTQPSSQGHYLSVRGQDYECVKRYFELRLGSHWGEPGFKLEWELRGF